MLLLGRADGRLDGNQEDNTGRSSPSTFAPGQGPGTTVTTGEAASETNVPAVFERSLAGQVGEPALVGALAPGPVPAREP